MTPRSSSRLGYFDFRQVLQLPGGPAPRVNREGEGWRLPTVLRSGSPYFTPTQAMRLPGSKSYPMPKGHKSFVMLRYERTKSGGLRPLKTGDGHNMADLGDDAVSLQRRRTLLGVELPSKVPPLALLALAALGAIVLAKKSGVAGKVRKLWRRRGG